MSEEKAPEQEADKKVQSEEDEDNSQRSACTPSGDLKVVKAEKPVPAAGEGDDDEHAQGTETCTEPSPATATWITEGECLAANHEGNHDLHGKRRSETKRRKLAPEYAPSRTWSAAVVVGMITLAVVTSCVAGADKGEAILRCPLPDNAIATDQGIIIKVFSTSTSDSAETVIYCLKRDNPEDKPNCHHNSCTVEKWGNQSLAFKCPKDILENRTFKVQGKDRFIPCSVEHFTDTGVGKNPNTEVTLVIVSVVIFVVVVVVIIVAVIAYGRRNNRLGRDGCMKFKWCPWNSPKKEPVTPEGEALNKMSV